MTFFETILKDKVLYKKKLTKNIYLDRKYKNNLKLSIPRNMITRRGKIRFKNRKIRKKKKEVKMIVLINSFSSLEQRE